MSAHSVCMRAPTAAAVGESGKMLTPMSAVHTHSPAALRTATSCSPEGGGEMVGGGMIRGQAGGGGHKGNTQVQQQGGSMFGTWGLHSHCRAMTRRTGVCKLQQRTLAHTATATMANLTATAATTRAATPNTSQPKLLQPLNSHLPATSKPYTQSPCQHLHLETPKTPTPFNTPAPTCSQALPRLHIPNGPCPANQLVHHLLAVSHLGGEGEGESEGGEEGARGCRGTGWAGCRVQGAGGCEREMVCIERQGLALCLFPHLPHLESHAGLADSCESCL